MSIQITPIFRNKQGGGIQKPTNNKHENPMFEDNQGGWHSKDPQTPTTIVGDNQGGGIQHPKKLQTIQTTQSLREIMGVAFKNSPTTQNHKTNLMFGDNQGGWHSTLGGNCLNATPLDCC